jgi:hypothetical protein
MNKVILRATCTLALSLGWGCAMVDSNPNPELVEKNLSKVPVGLFLEELNHGSSINMIDLTVRNNTGAFVGRLYVEVYVYKDGVQVGMTNQIFSSLGTGETAVYRGLLNSGGRAWTTWKYSYKVLD